MKKFLVLLSSLILLSACAQAINPFDNVESNNYAEERKTGDIGAFDLVSPTNEGVLQIVPTFTWQEANNAETYTLEICSSDTFVSDVESVTYYSRKNITTTSFTINSDLSKKDTNYYWRVHAVNSDHKITSTSTFSFYLKAPNVDEVEFDLGDADDWMLHNDGSHADITIDNTNFFGNNKEAVAITFKGEDTYQGPGHERSDGWIIVTRTVEKTTYGTDSLFLNIYYAGQDSTINIRLVDNDNEYWYIPVQISSNAKQQVLLKFEDFIQRTKDVPTSNMEFDHFRIKYLEVVFERTFGDGVCLISNVKAVKYDNYKDYFISELNFEEYQETDWVYESYEFEKVINGTELTLNYYKDEENGHKKINGYGFAKLVVNKYFAAGDAIKIKVKYSGNPGSNIVMRIYEEDTDRWSYSIPFSIVNTDDYTEFVIPYDAFGKSSVSDGRRQFYYIINIQFGLDGQYSEGSISFKDFEIVNKSDYQTSDRRVVGEDGLIENFDNYTSGADLYFNWQTTIENKDEMMSLNKSDIITSKNNVYAGQFEYKSDMAPAGYGIMLTAKGDFNALSICLKDASVKAGDSKYIHVTNWSPEVKIYIYLTTGERYFYTLSQLKRMWYGYTIPFDEFELENEDELRELPSEITMGGIILVGFTMSYSYYAKDGTHIPAYSMSNPVLADNIRFTNANEYTEVVRERIVKMDGDIALVDDFESYDVEDDLFDYWAFGKTYEYSEIKLSSEVSEEGGNRSMEANYRSKSDSVSYQITPAFDPEATGKGLVISIKGDGKATVFINIYINVATTVMQYRATLESVHEGWCEYVIGFSNFVNLDTASARRITNNDVTKISKITIGAIYSSDTTPTDYKLYFDNIKFDNSITFSANTMRIIGL